MADEKIDSEQFYLFDLLPGEPNPVYGEPLSGFDGATSHSVVAAGYNVGTKIQVYNETAGVAGYSTFVYGKLATEDSTNVMLVAHVLVQDKNSPTPFEFTNEVANDNGEGLSPVVFGAATLTVTYFGWFWCGGVCPEDWASGLGGFHYTDNTVAIGAIGSGDLVAPDQTMGEVGLAVTTATIATVGWAYVADQAL